MATTPKQKTITNPNTGAQSDKFLDTLQSRLLSQSEVISSQDTELESKIGEAIKGVQAGQQASAQRIESQFGREIGYAQEEGQRAITGNLEGRAGFATNMGVLREIVGTVDKNLNDLAQRKQELILAGEAEAAGKISELQLKAIEYKTQAQQRVFENLLSLSSLAVQRENQRLSRDQFGLAMKTEERLAKAQSFEERKAISQIAMEFGVPTKEGDTIETIVARAAPYASEERQLQLQKIRAEIANSKAQAAKALQGDKVNRIDSITAAALASAYRNGDTGFLAGLDGSEDAALVYGEIMRQDQEEASELNSMAANAVKSGKNINQFLSEVGSSPKSYSEEKARTAYASILASQPAPKKSGVPAVNVAKQLGKVAEAPGKAVAQFFTGNKPKGIFK